MIVELHILQNFAPSCLNRDDTNMPKDCEFGGVSRARISSQCQKRSIRLSDDFSNTIQVALGIRTIQVPQKLLRQLVESGRSEDKAKEIVAAFVSEALGKIDATMKSKAIVYLSEAEIDLLYQTISSNWDALVLASNEKPKKKDKEAPSAASNEKDVADRSKVKNKDAKTPLEQLCKQLVNEFQLGKITPDIALFGRMMAEKPDLKVEGAAQVAHAISTNKVNPEIDFYTAVDDLNSEEETGAGMMGTIAFNSACFYRYSVVDLDLLNSNLNGQKKENCKGNNKSKKNKENVLTKVTIEAFIRASVAAVPSGKQNSMAAHNPPSLVLVTMRNGHPISLANAFVKPVMSYEKEKEGDLIDASISRLDSYLCDVLDTYGTRGWMFMGATTLGGYRLEKLSKKGIKEFATFATMEDLYSSLTKSLEAQNGNTSPST
jgi:CRISPR system Cascade subunit CasC